MSLLKPVRNANFFSKNYFDRAIKECPKLATLSGEDLNDHMLTVLAFNLAYNAFYQGKRRTAIKLLTSVFNSTNLSTRVYCAAALLEIQICLELNYVKLAQHLLSQLCKNPFWQTASEERKECLEFLSARCKRANTKFLVDSNKLHWFLLDCEVQLKAGDSRNGLNMLFKRRRNTTGNERRIIDNAIGCVFAFYFKDCNMAESYFRNAMLRTEENDDSETIPILSSTLIYHTALAQLGSGKSKSSFLLFLSVWPFFIDNPRIWLRIAECCVPTKNDVKVNIFTKKMKKMQSRTSDLSTEPEELYQAAVYGFNAVKTIRSGKCVKVPEAISCNPEFAAYAIHQGLSIALSQKDFAYLLPYLYSLYAFVNIKLKRYECALKAATDLLNLVQINPRQKLMGMFYKTETLICLNKLNEAVACLQQASPLQSIAYTFSRIVYNRALLETLSGKYERALEILNELNGAGGSFVQRPEANLLRMYLDMRWKRAKIARQVFKSSNTLNFTAASPLPVALPTGFRREN